MVRVHFPPGTLLRQRSMTKTSLVETSLVAGAAQMLACRPRTVTVTKSKTTRISLGCYAEVPNEMAPLSIFPEGNAGSAQQEGTERAELNVRLEAAPTSPAFANRHVFVRSKGEVVPSRWKRENKEGAETVRHGEGRRRPDEGQLTALPLSPRVPLVTFSKPAMWVAKRAAKVAWCPAINVAKRAAVCRWFRE